MDNLKFGMVGLDTSHCEAFAALLHDEDGENHVPGGRIVSAYPGGSKDFSSSRDRVGGFTAKMGDAYGVKIVETPEEAAEGMDAVFLTSVDGRQHLEQFRALAPFGKPVFIDKPFATGTEDAAAIFELSRKHGAPVFSCSSLRYAAGVAELGGGSPVQGCEAFGPMAVLEDYPRYFWYGIHSAEVLFSKMGSGCVEVRVSAGEKADVITGLWKDGRIGTVYGYRIKETGAFGCTVFAEGEVASAQAKSDPPYYALLLPHVLDFFRTGKSPVSEEETMEITAFLEAADKSVVSGAAVKLQV